jgi:hypothetical protein
MFYLQWEFNGAAIVSHHIYFALKKKGIGGKIPVFQYSF